MKLDRLISILVILLRKERVQAKELAEMFGVSIRTVLRDIEAINLAGIPIVAYRGNNGGISIAEGYRLDKSVLTSDEMTTIITALKSVAATIPDRTQHDILMEKFKNTLSNSQLASLNLKTSQFIIDMTPWGGNSALDEKLKIIGVAIEDCRELTFIYISSKGEKMLRHVEPHTLVLKAQKWYLYAWCHDRKAFRIFKISRMKDLKELDQEFMRKEVSSTEISWGAEWYQSEKTIQLELLFEPVMESIIEEWFGEDAIKQHNGKFLVKVFLPENNWLYGFLLSFGPGVEVINPPHLRDIMAGMAEGVYKKYVP